MSIGFSISSFCLSTVICQSSVNQSAPISVNHISVNQSILLSIMFQSNCTYHLSIMCVHQSVPINVNHVSAILYLYLSICILVNQSYTCKSICTYCLSINHVSVIYQPSFIDLSITYFCLVCVLIDHLLVTL